MEVSVMLSQTWARDARALQQRSSRWPFKRVGLTFFGTAASFAALVVSCRHLDERTGRHYLDGLGIACAEWAVLALLAGFHVCFYTAPVEPRSYTLVAPAPHRVQEVLGNPSGSVRLQQCYFVAIFVQAGVNLGGIVYNFATLPPRDNSERLNEAKYLVSMFELPVACLSVITAILELMRSNWTGFKHWLFWTCRLSVLQALPLVSPWNVKALIATFYRELGGSHRFSQLTQAVVLLVWAFTLAILAMLSLLVKMDQVAFVVEQPLYEWDFFNWWRLVAFANNVISILPNEDAIQMRSLFLQFDPKQPAWALAQWLELLQERLQDKFGRWGLVLFCNLTSEEVRNLLQSDPSGGSVEAGAAGTAEPVLSMMVVVEGDPTVQNGRSDVDNCGDVVLAEMPGAAVPAASSAADALAASPAAAAAPAAACPISGRPESLEVGCQGAQNAAARPGPEGMDTGLVAADSLGEGAFSARAEPSGPSN